MASECHMDYFDDAFMVFYVSFWRHEDNSSTKNHRTFNSSRVFSKLCTILSQRRQERREEEKQRWRKIKEHKNVREATRAGEQRGNNISALTLKAQLGELKHTASPDLPPWGITTRSKANRYVLCDARDEEPSCYWSLANRAASGISCCQQRESEIN